jgi:diguanylate cyclase (GGDEF)-like protein
MRILIAEDDATSRLLLESLLRKWGYDVVVARDGEEAWRILSADNSPLIALVDWIMPGLEGPELCRRLRAHVPKDCSYRYIILVTVRDEKVHIVKGLESGADDYVTKPFDPHELRVRITAGQRVVELQEQLRQMALYDSLTKLMNRRAIFDRLEEELSRSRREGKRLCVGLIDLDFFKNVNDTLGHLVGDEVLQETARRIRSSLRNYDIAGRYGGEEFLVILPGASRDDALRTLERIRTAVGGTPMETRDGVVVTVTASLGFACDDGESKPDVLVRRADAALYRAKNDGRNRVNE